MTRHMLFLTTVALFGCAGDKDDTEETTGDTALFGSSIPIDAPVLRNCEAICRLNNLGGGKNFFQWSVTCLYDDPQGADTVTSMGDVRITQNDVKIADVQMVCGIREDGTPRCEQRFGADNISVSCQNEPESYLWSFTIYDIDGNAGTAEVYGRVQG